MIHSDLKIVDLRGAVTGGAGTAGSPWTGWETAMAGLTENTVFKFSAGVWRKTAKVTLSDTYDVMIEGAGEESTIIDNNVNDHCFEALAGAPEAMVTIRDLSIESSFASGSRTQGAAIYIDGPGRARVNISRVRLRQHYIGLHLSDVTNPHISHVQARDNVNDGFRVDGAAPSTTVNIYSPYLSGNGRYGIYMSSVVTGAVVGATSESNTGHNFYFSGCSDFTLVSPYSEDAETGTDAFHLDSVSRFTLIEPRCDSTGRDGLRFVGTAQACRQITVIGGALGGGTGYGANDVGLGTTEPITFIGTQLSGTSGALNDASGNITRISDYTAGKSIFAAAIQVDTIEEKTAAANITLADTLNFSDTASVIKWSDVMLKRNGSGQLAVRNGDDTAQGSLIVATLTAGGTVTGPTVTSSSTIGAASSTSPTIVARDSANTATAVATLTQGGAAGVAWLDLTRTRVPVAAKSANATLTDAEEVILVTTGGANRTMTLPAASGRAGKRYMIKKMDSGEFTVIVDANGAELIDGAATKSWATQYEAYILMCDGTGWTVF